MFRPSPEISPAQLRTGQRHLVLDLAWASLCGAFSSGVILAAFALSLQATPLQMGLLAAIPAIAQVAQLPATVAIERLRRRRAMGVLTITGGRVLLLAMALLPLVASQHTALWGLFAVQAGIAVLGALGACAVNSWLHQLIPAEQLGGFFSRRLLFGTLASCAGTLIAGVLVERGNARGALQGYALAFAVAALCGFVSSWHLARAPELEMGGSGPAVSIAERLMQPFRDRNFRHLLRFLAAWTAASSLVAPFLTVYLLRQRDLGVEMVTRLWVVSQVANALTLYAWGRVSDRFSNKAVLAVVLPLYFASVLALVFAGAVSDELWQVVLLYAVHFAMGVATGGIGLATGNLGLKLAPQGEGTPYLAAIGLVCAASGGIAPLAGGAIAETLKAWQISAVLRWGSPGGAGEASLVHFAHWEILFAIACLSGLYVMHRLSAIDEGEEVSERVVVQEFALEAARTMGSVSSVAGALGNIFPFERLSERRRWWRGRVVRPQRP